MTRAIRIGVQLALLTLLSSPASAEESLAEKMKRLGELLQEAQPEQTGNQRNRQELEDIIRGRTRSEDTKWRTYGDGCQVNWESWKKGNEPGTRYAVMRSIPSDLKQPITSFAEALETCWEDGIALNCKALKVSKRSFSGNWSSYKRPRPGDWEERLLLDICSTLPASERAVPSAS